MLEEKEILQLLFELRNADLTGERQKYIWEKFSRHEKDIQFYLRKKFEVNFSFKSEEETTEIDRIYLQLKQRMAVSEKGHLRVNKGQRVFVLNRKWFSVAAVFLLGMTGAFCFWLLNMPSHIDKSNIPQQNMAVDNAYDTLYNFSSGKQVYTLRDGTIVELDDNSFIYFKKKFPLDKKIVYLNGSAIFKVNKEKNRPFSVYVNNIEIRDLGTIFSVKTHNSCIKVKLIKGKVLIHSLLQNVNLKDIALVPGEEFIWNSLTLYHTINNTYKKKDIAINNTCKKTTNELFLSKGLQFKNASLEEVFNKLKEQCNISIIYNGVDIEEKSFTATINAGSGLENIVNRICLTNDLHYEIKGETIYIHK